MLGRRNFNEALENFMHEPNDEHFVTLHELISAADAATAENMFNELNIVRQEYQRTRLTSPDLPRAIGTGFVGGGITGIVVDSFVNETMSKTLITGCGIVGALLNTGLSIFSAQQENAKKTKEVILAKQLYTLELLASDRASSNVQLIDPKQPPSSLRSRFTRN